MIQAFGLTSNPRKAHPPDVDDVSFEARAGHVTSLLGATGAGKTTVLRLALELQQGRGITCFRGRPLHRIAHPAREVGVLLGDVPGHPARSVRGHLRMLCAAAGVPARRADEVLEVVGLAGLREERLGTLSRGMDRRLGLACALLGDPHTLVLDEPTEGLSAGEARWVHGMLRAHASQGGTVLVTTADPKEASRTADHVVTLDGGRLVADQKAGDFARTRLRPRVAVRSPHAARLAALITKEARVGRRSVEVVREDGNRLSVYGSTTADIGEMAFRHGILVHQLADEVGDMGPGAGDGPDGGTMTTEPAHVVSGPSSAETARTSSATSSAETARTHSGTSSTEPESEPGAGVPVGDEPAAAGARAVSTSSAGERRHAASGVSLIGQKQAGPGRAPGEQQAAVGLTAFAEPRRPHSLPERAATDGATSDSATAATHRAEVRASGATAGGPGRMSADGTSARGVSGAEAPLGRTSVAGATARETAADPTAAAGASDALDALDARNRSGRAADLDRAAGPDRTAASGDAAGPRPGVGQPDTERPAPAEAATDREPSVEAHASRFPETPDARPGAEPSAPAGTTGTGATSAAGAALPGARNPGTRRHEDDDSEVPAGSPGAGTTTQLPPPISVRSARTPLRPLRYELRRATGIGTGFLTCGAVLVVSALTAVLLARVGHTPQARLFAAWPRELPLPPVALAAGLLGALAFGDEFRHPALAADRGTVPRRLGLLAAKLLVSGATALLLALLTLGCDAEALYLVYGRELTEVPADWLSLSASWFGLVTGCAWAGVLAAGVFRSTTAGLAAVLAVPVAVVPLAHKALGGEAVSVAGGLAVRMRELLLLQWPFGGERYLLATARVVTQPVGGAMTLSLCALLCAYVFTTLRTRTR
ncbi:ATP-binding cassette domain-containing protein [Streptomyces sp. NPDC090108]|uniref:ATP-binding cassette domain-containing protein n=1 Tax=Streptomyces sp. NPDC090108 TaxID=3365947 RepID=UPI0038219AE4